MEALHLAGFAELCVNMQFDAIFLISYVYDVSFSAVIRQFTTCAAYIFTVP